MNNQANPSYSDAVQFGVKFQNTAAFYPGLPARHYKIVEETQLVDSLTALAHTTYQAINGMRKLQQPSFDSSFHYEVAGLVLKAIDEEEITLTASRDDLEQFVKGVTVILSENIDKRQRREREELLPKLGEQAEVLMEVTNNYSKKIKDELEDFLAKFSRTTNPNMQAAFIVAHKENLEELRRNFKTALAQYKNELPADVRPFVEAKINQLEAALEIKHLAAMGLLNRLNSAAKPEDIEAAYGQYNNTIADILPNKKEDLLRELAEIYDHAQASFGSGCKKAIKQNEQALIVKLMDMQDEMQKNIIKQRKEAADAGAVFDEAAAMIEAKKHVKQQLDMQMRDYANKVSSQTISNVSTKDRDEHSQQAHTASNISKTLDNEYQQELRKDQAIEKYYYPSQKKDLEKHDKEITFRNNIRVRTYEGGLTMTLPAGYNETTLTEAAEIMRDIYGVTEKDHVHLMSSNIKHQAFLQERLKGLPASVPEPAAAKSALASVKKHLADFGNSVGRAIGLTR